MWNRIFIITCLYITFTFGRRIHHHQYHQNEEEDFVEDFDNSFNIEDELRREQIEADYMR